MMFSRLRLHFLALSAALFIFLMGPVVSAQEAVPIDINTNTFGEFSGDVRAISYVLDVVEPQTIVVQVLALADELLVSFDVLNPEGITIASVPNTTAQNMVTTTVSPTVAGLYRIVVRSESSVDGQLLLTVLAVGELSEAEPLVVGQQNIDAVDTENPLQIFTFASTGDALFLDVEAQHFNSAPVVALRDAATGRLLAVHSADLAAVNYRLSPPANPVTYRLEITFSGGTDSQAFSVCLAAADNPGLCGPAPATASGTTPAPAEQVEIPPEGPCQATTLTTSAVNIRRGPSLDFPVIAALSSSDIVPIIGRLADNSWYQVNAGGTIGWVSMAVVRVGGLCGSVAVMIPPTAPAPITAQAATPAATINEATATVTVTSTATATWTPAAVATLNFSLPPVYGSSSLAAGFVPDPFNVGITGGGVANTTYLGSGCTGFTTSAPSFSVLYTGGAFPLLRFYFVGSGDATMVINTPSGNYVCSDDSYGTFHPTIDFNSPGSGRYDVWIGSFTQVTSIPGTLYVTENGGNHP